MLISSGYRTEIPFNEIMSIQRPYSGRVVFDHLPKTAGTAINRWLLEALGEGNVSDILSGLHRGIVNRHGGRYSLITGHLDFINGEGLDPKWRYVTLLRHPVDRVISWLYYVINHYSVESLPGVYESCRQFIDSEGESLSDTIYPSISNIYAAHFSRILGLGTEDDRTRLANSLTAIERYDLAGVYDDLPGFVEQFATFLGLTHVPPLRRENRTEGRPAVSAIPDKLKNTITQLNVLDVELFEAVQDKVKAGFWRDTHKQAVEIVALPASVPNCRTSEGITVNSVNLLGDKTIVPGEILVVEVSFELTRPINSMQAGLHIVDENGEVAFGTNSTLLESDFQTVLPGSHRSVYQIAANLPLGNYRLGVSFYEHTSSWPQELYWHDGICEFSVMAPSSTKGIGYAPCRAQMALAPGNSLAIGDKK